MKNSIFDLLPAAKSQFRSFKGKKVNNKGIKTFCGKKKLKILG